jgi:hypothetical protein
MMKRKVGRPKGSKNKKKTIDSSIQKHKEATLKLAEIGSVVAKEHRLNNTIDHLNADIANLKHQIIGYKAVISYLENQLGLKGSQ